MAKRTFLGFLVMAAVVVADASSARAQDLGASLEDVLYPQQAVYGGGLRARWVSVPSWMLNAFAKENVPLSSYHTGVELVRRKDDLDIVLGLSFQDMSPPDGNWLGRGKNAAVDTDRVFVDLAMWSMDVMFIWNRYFNEYVGLRYGAGLGFAVLSGQVDRISAATPGGGQCNADNAGDESACFPQVPACGPEGCNKSALEASRGSTKDAWNAPRLFKEQDVPGALPILHLLVGPMLRIPDVPGLEIRGDFGFFNAFFAGLSINYVR